MRPTYLPVRSLRSRIPLASRRSAADKHTVWWVGFGLGVGLMVWLWVVESEKVVELGEGIEKWLRGTQGPRLGRPGRRQ